MRQSTEGNILVVRGGAIGDFILTLPALAALRLRFPGARLEVLGYSRIAGLAVAGGLADEVRSIDARPLAGFFARHGSLDPGLVDYFARFDVILSYLYDPDHIFQSNVALCSKAQFIAGPHRPDDLAGLHATEVFLGPLKRLAIFDADPTPRLSLARTFLSAGCGEFPGCHNSESNARKPESDRSGTIRCLALHPGSGSDRKNWPKAKWAELLRELVASSSMRLLLVGGEAEAERWPRLMAELSDSRIEPAWNLPLPELARRLADCGGFVGHDSGITHLAAAVGLPVIVLWGESAEPVWRPRGERVTVLRHGGGLEHLPVSTVLESTRKLVGGSRLI